MQDQNSVQTPTSPETQPPAVRRDLEQAEISHQGQPIAPAEPHSSDAASYMGATEENVTPINPPVSGPAVVTQPGSPTGDTVDPETELTPG